MPFKIIQGGMGVGVSSWQLARAVSLTGQLGVISGIALAVILARRLQDGDAGGHMRRAMQHFPIAGVAERTLNRYFIPGGKPSDAPYLATPLPQLPMSDELTELTVLGNFVEVHLAKEGHTGLIGANYLEKLQIPTQASLFGAMLAGVDYILMGAGIPRFIPGTLDALSRGEAVDLRIDVAGAANDQTLTTHFDPVAFCGGKVPALKRPKFFAIVSSVVLAQTLARKSNGRVDGFVIEGATAGGHNAPPRGPMQVSAIGEPVYGPRDAVDLQRFREIGLPYWLAGGYADPKKLAAALAEGAQGIQVGTAFAFCAESGIADDLKSRVLAASQEKAVDVFTDPLASPTGYPFKVLSMSGTLSDATIYAQRERRCDLGYLRANYLRADGTLGHRCPAEAVEQYVSKGGDASETAGRKCICNALFATIGLGQTQAAGQTEAAIVTAGDDAAFVAKFLKPGEHTYTAADVVRYLLEPAAAI